MPIVPLVLALALLLGGTVHIAERTGHPCIFGSANQAVNEQCAVERYGAEGGKESALYALNASAKRATTCLEHFRLISEKRPDANPLYTTVRGVNHVSALVDGYVLDNGALQIPGGVMKQDEFDKWYGKRYWLTAPGLRAEPVT